VLKFLFIEKRVIMKNVKNCLFFAFGVAAAIAVALLYSRVSCCKAGAADRMKENIKETLDEAAHSIEKGAEIVEGALKKSLK
jgi:hypothetical protein